jgi:hypothetical protein
MLECRALGELVSGILQSRKWVFTQQEGNTRAQHVLCTPQSFKQYYYINRFLFSSSSSLSSSPSVSIGFPLFRHRIWHYVIIAGKDFVSVYTQSKLFQYHNSGRTVRVHLKYTLCRHAPLAEMTMEEKCGRGDLEPHVPSSTIATTGWPPSPPCCRGNCIPRGAHPVMWLPPRGLLPVFCSRFPSLWSYSEYIYPSVYMRVPEAWFFRLEVLVLVAGEYVTVISWGAVPEDARIIFGPEEQFS